MNDRTSQFVFVGFWKRVLAGLVDAAIGCVFMPFTIPMLVWSLRHRTILPGVLWCVAWTMILLWFVVRFGGTPGKLAIRARIVDADGHFLSWGRAVLRIVPSLIVSITHFLQMGTAFSRYPETVPHSSYLEFGRILNQYGQPFAMLSMIFVFLFYVDIGAILFNKQKRAIHDFIAGSYVVTKKSYMAAAEPVGPAEGHYVPAAVL